MNLTATVEESTASMTSRSDEWSIARRALVLVIFRSTIIGKPGYNFCKLPMADCSQALLLILLLDCCSYCSSVREMEGEIVGEIVVPDCCWRWADCSTRLYFIVGEIVVLDCY